MSNEDQIIANADDELLEKYREIDLLTEQLNQARTSQRKAEHERDAACKRFESYAINNTHWGVENSELRDALEEISDRASEYECECEHDFETGKLESVCLRCVVFRILKESKINPILEGP